MSSVVPIVRKLPSQSLYSRRVSLEYFVNYLRSSPRGSFPYISFLQFGSPHSLSSQAQYISAVRSEVWVNIGYRLSAFGFLACDEPKISGNFGFKDQWMALEYIKDNISAFGGKVLSLFALCYVCGNHLGFDFSNIRRKPRRHPSDRSFCRLHNQSQLEIEIYPFVQVHTRSISCYTLPRACPQAQRRHSALPFYNLMQWRKHSRELYPCAGK
jgi:Carboxylesterase family